MEIKRLRQEATDKEGNSINLEIKLNEIPSPDWLYCFKNPSNFNYSVHPRGMRLIGDKLIFGYELSGIDSAIKWVDKYIDQANKSYKQMMEKRAEEETKRKQIEKEKKEEINEINEKLKGL